MGRGQLDPWLWIAFVIFVLFVVVAYGGHEAIARHGGDAWDILTMLS